MPSRLRPTASLAADAILVGDPGRALLLAQELLEQPKMSNHARGLWGYSGQTPAGRALTIQATGMGGPSAAVVLADLAKLGVRRARAGRHLRGDRCGARAGELLVVGEAIATGGSATAFGVGVGEAVEPDPELTARLDRRAGGGAEARPSPASTPHPGHQPAPAGAVAADMQTAATAGPRPLAGHRRSRRSDRRRDRCRRAAREGAPGAGREGSRKSCSRAYSQPKVEG